MLGAIKSASKFLDKEVAEAHKSTYFDIPLD